MPLYSSSISTAELYSNYHISTKSFLPWTLSSLLHNFRFVKSQTSIATAVKYKNMLFLKGESSYQINFHLLNSRKFNPKLYLMNILPWILIQLLCFMIKGKHSGSGIKFHLNLFTFYYCIPTWNFCSTQSYCQRFVSSKAYSFCSLVILLIGFICISLHQKRLLRPTSP